MVGGGCDDVRKEGGMEWRREEGGRKGRIKGGREREGVEGGRGGGSEVRERRRHGGRLVGKEACRRVGWVGREDKSSHLAWLPAHRHVRDEYGPKSQRGEGARGEAGDEEGGIRSKEAAGGLRVVTTEERGGRGEGFGAAPVDRA